MYSSFIRANNHFCFLAETLFVVSRLMLTELLLGNKVKSTSRKVQNLHSILKKKVRLSVTLRSQIL